MGHLESTSYNLTSNHHSFDLNLAASLHSVDQAIFIHHISYWLDYNKRMKKNFHEGKYWTYQTLDDLHGHFPYWSLKQLRLIIDKLVKLGILIKGNFNVNKYDHTIWYALDFEKVNSICPKGQIEATERADQYAQKGRPIPDNKTYNKTNTSKEDIASNASLRSYDILFSFENSKFEGITEIDILKWKDLYPSVEITRELKLMEEWCLANSKKAKSKKKWRQFINNWLRENNDKNINKQAYQSNKKNDGISSSTYEKNYELSKRCHLEYDSKNYTLTVLTKNLEFTPKGTGQPICLNYSELGFSEQLENTLRKCGFHKKEPLRFNKIGQRIDENGNIIKD